MASKKPIPAQREGVSADIIEIRIAPDLQEAKLLFLKTRERLYDINRWGDISDGLSAVFNLTDDNGLQRNDFPSPGDYIRINIPGPGSVAGDGYDWVKIEQVEDKRMPDADEEWSAMKVRPAEDPVKKEGTAHFFEDCATSTFIVKRKDTIVSAQVHGRNEKPNTSAKKIVDKVRNALVGTAAATGVSKIQWQKLVKGLLYKNDPG